MERTIVPQGSAKLKNDGLVNELLSHAGVKLGKTTGQPVNVRLIQRADDKILDEMLRLDEVFRPELRYDRETYTEGLESPDAALLFVYGEKPMAFAIRYWDDYLRKYDPKGFRSTYFADEMAVTKEMQGKRIGPVLMSLSCILAKQLGYGSLALFCEAVNDDGRNLPAYYRKLGFSQYAQEDEEDGIPMRVRVDDGTIKKAAEFLKTE